MAPETMWPDPTRIQISTTTTPFTPTGSSIGGQDLRIGAALALAIALPPPKRLAGLAVDAAAGHQPQMIGTGAPARRTPPARSDQP
jgi:hypothetical protein